jgi:hypothetical protein
VCDWGNSERRCLSRDTSGKEDYFRWTLASRRELGRGSDKLEAVLFSFAAEAGDNLGSTFILVVLQKILVVLLLG